MTLDTYRPEFERVITHIQRELGTIHTGRATPAIVEDVTVEVYGSRMSVRELATISALDARTLQIDPWDKTILKDVEKGIRVGQPNLNPVNDGKVLRIPMPPLTEEARRSLAKLIGQKVEAAKQAIRKVRDDARSAILDAQAKKEITEDDRYRLQRKLDEMSEEFTAKLKEVGEQKVSEVMAV